MDLVYIAINDDPLLFVSIQSALAFLPWIRRIHVVTSVAFINVWGTRVQITPVSTLFPSEGTVNVNQIETKLHQIPGLTEQFLYSDCSIMVGKELSPHHFFTKNGNPQVSVSKGLLVPEKMTKLLSHVRSHRYQWMPHQMKPLRRTFFIMAWNYPVMASTFTTRPSVSPVDVLLHWQFDMGRVTVGNLSCKRYLLNDTVNLNVFFQTLPTTLDFYNIQIDIKTPFAHRKLWHHLHHHLPHCRNYEKWRQSMVTFEETFLPQCLQRGH
jgi:hypothetical protein